MYGKKLKGWVDRNFAQTIVPPDPTHLHNYLDIAVTRNFPYPYSIQTLNDLNSDHLPVILRYHVDSYDLNIPLSISTRWQDFSFLLENRNTPEIIPDSKAQAEEAIAQLGEILRDTFEQCSQPRKSTFDNPRLPVEIRQMITERNRARRAWQVHRIQYYRTQLNNLNRKIKAAISEFKNTRWNEFVESLSTSDNTIWKTASRIRRTRSHIPAINSPNGMVYTHSEKAEAIAESLRSQFTPHADLENPRLTAVLENTVKNFIQKDTPNTLAPATPTEVCNYISGLKKNKSPGEDRISTNMLINLPQNFILYLVILINCMMNLKIFPDSWKSAIVVPLPKSGADDIHNPSNFRPISLLSCLSKVYEHVLVNRLVEFLDSRDVLIPEQFGFRARHSTQHQV